MDKERDGSVQGTEVMIDEDDEDGRLWDDHQSDQNYVAVSPAQDEHERERPVSQMLIETYSTVEGGASNLSAAHQLRHLTSRPWRSGLGLLCEAANGRGRRGEDLACPRLDRRARC